MLPANNLFRQYFAQTHSLQARSDLFELVDSKQIRALEPNETYCVCFVLEKDNNGYVQHNRKIMVGSLDILYKTPKGLNLDNVAELLHGDVTLNGIRAMYSDSTVWLVGDSSSLTCMREIDYHWIDLSTIITAFQ